MLFRFNLQSRERMCHPHHLLMQKRINHLRNKSKSSNHHKKFAKVNLLISQFLKKVQLLHPHHHQKQISKILAPLKKITINQKFHHPLHHHKDKENKFIRLKLFSLLMEIREIPHHHLPLHSIIPKKNKVPLIRQKSNHQQPAKMFLLRHHHLKSTNKHTKSMNNRDHL